MQELSPFVIKLDHYLSLGAIVASCVLVVYVVYLAIVAYKNKTSKVTSVLAKCVLPLGFLVTFSGMLMSLYYSEFLRIIPCDLCWFQRIFMYSLTFIFGLAWYKKDKNILPYTTLLSFIGFCIAVYHHMLQIGFDIYKPCSTAPFAVDCSKPTFIEFGFVTFPYFAVVLFGTLLLLSLTHRYFAKKD